MYRSSCVLIMSALAASHAFASTLLVCPQGCGFATVQSAIDSASSGDLIYIGPGVYRENVSITGKSLTLRGVGDRTILGAPEGSVLTLQCSDAQPVIKLVELVVQNGRTPYDGGGIANNYCTLEVRDSLITRNHAAGYGGAIYSSGPLTIDDSTISANSANSGGGLVSASPAVSMSITRTVFRDNRATCGGGNATGGSAVLSYGVTHVRGSYFANNVNEPANVVPDGPAEVTATTCRGTIHNALGNMMLERTILDGNRAGIANAGTMSVDSVSIVASDGLSQAVFNSGTLSVKSSLIGFSAGVPLIDNTGVAKLVDTTILDSNSGHVPFVIRNSGSLTLIRDLITGNRSEGTNPAVLHNTGTMTLRQTTISGNDPDTCSGTSFSCPIGP